METLGYVGVRLSLVGFHIRFPPTTTATLGQCLLGEIHCEMPVIYIDNLVFHIEFPSTTTAAALSPCLLGEIHCEIPVIYMYR